MTAVNITSQETVYSWTYTSVISAQINEIKDFFCRTMGMIADLGKEVKANQSDSETLWEAQTTANARQVEEIERIYEFALGLQQKLDAQEGTLLELKQLQEKTEEELKKTIEEATVQRKQIQELEELQDILVSYGNNTENLPAFHYAIKMGDKRAVELMLEHGADVESRVGKDKLTALHQAALAKQLEVSIVLLQNGADINARLADSANNKLTALHYAAESGSDSVIKCLIENGANVNLDAVDDKNNPNRAKTPLHIAAELGNFDAIVALVNGGADVNKGRITNQYNNWLHDRDGGPLDKAVEKLKYSDNPKNLDVIKFLVEHGAQRRYQRYDHMPCPVIKGYLESVGR